MKILITYASAGAGHFKAAQAIYDYFKKNKPDIEVKLIDALDYSSYFFRKAYINGYSFAVNYATWFWAASFYLTSLKPLRFLINRLRFFITIINTSDFTKLLICENPDWIISTHFLPSEITASLKGAGRIRTKLITVITDFGVHPFWLSEPTDTYIAASNFTREQLIARGVDKSKIKVLGIPVAEKFQRIYERGILAQKLGIDSDRFTILIVTGSFGIGPIEGVVDLLYRDAQILAVCARNKNLFNKLSHKNYPGVKVFAFADNMEELMAVSDIIITKPGGLSISEILAMELVPVFISAIPGQETGNIKALKRYGIGQKVRNIKGIRCTVLNYRDNPDKLIRIKENIRKLRKPSIVKEIADVVCSGSIGDTC